MRWLSRQTNDADGLPPYLVGAICLLAFLLAFQIAMAIDVTTGIKGEAVQILVGGAFK